MAQRIMRKKNRSSVKGVAVKKIEGQTVEVVNYGTTTSITVTSGKKKKSK